MSDLSDYAPENTTARTALHRALRDTALIWLVLVIYGYAAVVIGIRFNASLATAFVSFVPAEIAVTQVGLALCILMVSVRLALVERPSRPLARLWRMGREYLQPEVAILGCLLLATNIAMQIIYAFIKPLIPQMSGGFQWDRVLANADRVLFFGHQPWEVLWPVLGSAPVIFALSVLYHFWFVWGLLVWTLVAFNKRRREKNLQYFLAHVLMWSVGGSLVATVFAAAGPCYYGLLHAGPDPFAGLMTRLHAVNDHIRVPSLVAQRALWDDFIHPDVTRIAGISAFPSLHVAGSVLRTRIAFVHSFKLGVTSAVATVLVFFATIMLGWHYAVDGIAGATIALGCWSFAGILMRWWRLGVVAASTAPSVVSNP